MWIDSIILTYKTKLQYEGNENKTKTNQNFADLILVQECIEAGHVIMW